ncbi:MAG TPA: hypothetical protein VHY33_14930 [Thermoanaerobaculia bacterium]|nr:hypothetical protein [Thermoanaerobaculia bacterium]
MQVLDFVDLKDAVPADGEEERDCRQQDEGDHAEGKRVQKAQWLRIQFG